MLLYDADNGAFEQHQGWSSFFQRLGNLKKWIHFYGVENRNGQSTYAWIGPNKEPLLSALSNYLKVQQFGLLYGTGQATLYYFDWLSLGLLRQQKFRAAWQHAIERKPNGHTLHILYILWYKPTQSRLNFYSILRLIVPLPFAHLSTNHSSAKQSGLQKCTLIGWKMSKSLRNDWLIGGSHLLVLLGFYI